MFIITNGLFNDAVSTQIRRPRYLERCDMDLFVVWALFYDAVGILDYTAMNSVVCK
jgi:hypothetical protein